MTDHKWDEEGWVTTRGLVMRSCVCGQVWAEAKWRPNARQLIQDAMREHKRGENDGPLRRTGD